VKIFDMIDTILSQNNLTAEDYLAGKGFRTEKVIRPRLMTIIQLMSYLSCSKAAAYRLVKDGRLKSVNLEGIGVRIKIEDAEAFIAQAEETVNV